MLGFVIGPAALGWVNRSMLDAFEPIADVALGWLALVLGLEYAFLGRRRVKCRVSSQGASSRSSRGSRCGRRVLHREALHASVRGTELILFAGASARPRAETTRSRPPLGGRKAPRARGSLDLLGRDRRQRRSLPFLATAFSLPSFPLDHVRCHSRRWVGRGSPSGLGVLFGAVAATLLGREFRLQESWGVLFGTSLFAIGIAARLDLSFLALMFFMGITLAAFSHHRDEVVAMVAPTESPVLLPALLLAGARINPAASPGLAYIVMGALGARIVAKLVAGGFLRAAFPPARRAGASLGLGLLSAGALAMAVGLSFALRFPGEVGDTILVTVAVITVFGEFVGPNRLRAVLERSGELTEAKESGPASAVSAATSSEAR